jgi:hypothetical protein
VVQALGQVGLAGDAAAVAVLAAPVQVTGVATLPLQSGALSNAVVVAVRASAATSSSVILLLQSPTAARR